MSILKILEEKKAKMDLNRIKKHLKSFNTKVYKKNNEKITINTFQNLSLTHNSHNNQEELTLYGDVVYKKELAYDGDFYSVLDIDKIKDIKNYVKEVNPFNYPEEIHESTIEEALEKIEKRMKYINTGDFNSSMVGNDLTLINKIGNIRYEQKITDIDETNSTQLQTKIFINDEVIFNNINETTERKEKNTILSIDSKKIMKAKEEIDNVLNQSVHNKPANKSSLRQRM